MSFSPQEGEAAADLGAAAPTVNVLECQATRFCGKPDAHVCIRVAGAYRERGTRPRVQLRDGLPVCWPQLINRVKPATLK